MNHWVSVCLAAVFLAVVARAADEETKREIGVEKIVGCASTGLCCQGKNNTCRVVTSAPSSDNEVTEHKTEASCFCDSACLDIGDCCADYKDACKPVDCVLAEDWDDWGECDVRCGTGTKQRVRQIVQAPLNGGRPCEGSTVEKAVCEGTSCKVARAPDGFEELSETGKIIPAKFGAWRKDKEYNPFEDIRKNLFEHYENQTVFYIPSYCMQFEVTDVRQNCLKVKSDDAWTTNLVKGSELCVECQALAMRRKLGGRCRGHGVLKKETRWTAFASTVSGCHGKWVMKSRQEGCQCDKESPLSFILI